jgi:hypothetical protein
MRHIDGLLWEGGFLIDSSAVQKCDDSNKLWLWPSSESLSTWNLPFSQSYSNPKSRTVSLPWITKFS